MNNNSEAAQQENHDQNGGSKNPEDNSFTEKEIQGLTVLKLREICVLNNLGGERALKKDLVKKVTDFYMN